MMNFDEAARLVRLQERVRWGTIEALKTDGHHKSAEAHVELHYVLPGMFSDSQRPYWAVSIYSYVLGPNRNHSWQGASASEALALAERDVRTWVMKYETAAFERAMGVHDADDDELHASDCAMHNGPAMPNGPCDCRDGKR